MKIVKKLLIGLVVLIICLVAALASVRLYLQWSKQYYFGKIIEQQESSFTLQTDTGMSKKVVVSPETKIKRGRDSVVLLAQQGESVMVIGSINESGDVEARFIRLVKNDSSK